MEEFHISSPLIWKEADSEKILVGKVLASKLYSKTAIESILRKAWNLQDGFDVVEISGNVFMFKFSAIDEFDRILRGRPWSINGCLLNLMERAKYKSFEDFDFSRCPIWIQLHNVPMEAMCLGNTITIGSYVGEVEMAEDPVYNGRYLRNFLRVRVLLDLRKPLACGFWLPRPDGRKVWISVRFEKLQQFCYNCGRVGHENKSCKVDKLMSLIQPSEPRFGEWLTTNACRNWDEVMVVVNDEWAEVGCAMKRKDEALNRRMNNDKFQNYNELAPGDEDLFLIKVLNSSSENKERKRWKINAEARLKPQDTVKPGDGRLSSDTEGDDRISNLNGGRLKHEVGDEFIDDPTKRAKDVYTSPIPSASSGLNKQLDHVDLSVSEQGEQALAMVVFDGSVMTEVITGMDCMGLKRKATDKGGLEESKRRKVDSMETQMESDISVFAANLRRTKTRIRRYDRRKGRRGKENFLMLSGKCEEDMEVSPTMVVGDSGFVFKARKGRQSEVISDGVGGCPLTATKGP